MRLREIDLTDLCVVLALAAALLLTILREQQELAMSIAGGLMGYIGASSRSHTARRAPPPTVCPWEMSGKTELPKEEKA